MTLQIENLAKRFGAHTPFEGLGLTVEADRKSTRLNSSH